MNEDLSTEASNFLKDLRSRTECKGLTRQEVSTLRCLFRLMLLGVTARVNVLEIQQTLSVSEKVARKSLKLLEKQGWVTMTKVGGRHYFHLNLRIATEMTSKYL